MCGITGFLDRTGRSEREMRQIAERMTGTLAHRGPDGAGIWLDVPAGLGLGHRRLSILDLSPLGSQPMQTPDARYCISFNGEVYNHRELRRELGSAGHVFRSTSDTEVLLAAIAAWGLPRALERSIGMFAVAVWERQSKTLTIARDRFGIKPLYYGWIGDTFAFGSELKALRAHPDFRAVVDRHALGLYLRNGYVPHPHCILEGVRQLPPGTLLTLPAGGGPESLRRGTWWDSVAIANSGTEDSDATRDESTAVDRLQAVLSDAVALRMEADVPLGAFLSGGIDSSAVVALMQSQSAAPVRTFSIGFSEADYDEAGFARAVAQHLGTDHTEYYVTPQEARDVIPNLPEMFDEPFGDASQLPTYLVSALARRDVTVCLSGDGGDELFCGYQRYFTLQRFWNKIAWCPRGLRQLAGSCIPRSVGATGRFRFTRRLRALRQLLNFADGSAAYHWFHAHWRDPAEIVQCEPRGGETEGESGSATVASTGSTPAGDLFAQMALRDTVTYLPDDILVKVDRASMAVGLEARVPLLDHRVAELAWRLPHELKVRDGQGKWLLRQMLQRFVPRELFERPKMGFGVPLDDWLRGPLRAWAESLLDENRLRSEGYLHPSAVRAKWEEHLAGTHDWQYLLWDVLMFQAWLESIACTPAPEDGSPNA